MENAEELARRIYEATREGSLNKTTAASAGTVQEAVGHMISGVPFISQENTYPTGCESVSAVMACQYAGISIQVDTFIRSYLPKADFEIVNGLVTGYHPDQFFMGSPYESTGLGCFAPCIEKAIRMFLPPGYALVNTTGRSLFSLCEEFIDKDIPVIIWATRYMNRPYKGMKWMLHGGGEYQWIAREHCLVLTGYDRDYYYFNDPMAGTVKYGRSLTEQRYSAMGMQSLVVYRDLSQLPAPAETVPVTPDAATAGSAIPVDPGVPQDTQETGTADLAPASGVPVNPDDPQKPQGATPGTPTGGEGGPPAGTQSGGGDTPTGTGEGPADGGDTPPAVDGGTGDEPSETGEP